MSNEYRQHNNKFYRVTLQEISEADLQFHINQNTDENINLNEQLEDLKIFKKNNGTHNETKIPIIPKSHEL